MVECASALAHKRTPWTLSKSAATNRARVVAANWNLRTRLKVPQPGHPYTFFGATTAALFIQLSDDLRRCNFILIWRRTLLPGHKQKYNHRL
jgi:hypothetical protein